MHQQTWKIHSVGLNLYRIPETVEAGALVLMLEKTIQVDPHEDSGTGGINFKLRDYRNLKQKETLTPSPTRPKHLPFSWYKRFSSKGI